MPIERDKCMVKKSAPKVPAYMYSGTGEQQLPAGNARGNSWVPGSVRALGSHPGSVRADLGRRTLGQLMARPLTRGEDGSSCVAFSIEEQLHILRLHFLKARRTKVLDVSPLEVWTL